ncbi:MAG: hypothetical protein AAGE84_03455 [Cyanobacteria bacterium P01_G01_bin.39]
MYLSITKVLLATFILLFRPTLTQAESRELKNDYQDQDGNIERVIDNQFLLANKELPQYTLFLTNNKTTLQPSLYNSFPSNLVLSTQTNILRESEIKQIVEQIITFKPGVASWQTSSKLGVLELDGNFNSLAQLIKGKASWKSQTILGLVDVLVNVDQQISLLNTATAWKVNTALGTVAIKSNFDQDITFMGANATWNTDTPLGSLFIKGNFDHQIKLNGANATWSADTALGSLFVKGNFAQTNFTGGKVKVASNALIGLFKADIKIDHKTHFHSANASWSANLPFGSNIKVDGSFNQKKAFTGGSIKFGTKSTLGNLGIKANLDGDTNLTSGSAFWEAQAGLGSIILNADLKKDGNYNSELSIHFPL